MLDSPAWAQDEELSTYAHFRIHDYVCAHVCMYEWACMYVFVCLQVYVHAVCMCTCLCSVCKCIHMYFCLRMCVSVYIYIYTYAYQKTADPCYWQNDSLHTKTALLRTDIILAVSHRGNV